MINRTPAEANGLRITLADGSTFVTGVESVSRILRLTLYGARPNHGEGKQGGPARSGDAALRRSYPASLSRGSRRAP